MHRSLNLLGAGPARAKVDPLPLLAKGFRPFFLLAGLHAVLIVPMWLAVLRGLAPPSSYLPPSVWHAHEMLAGFATAVIAGFLLTAVGNWTQRETATGPALALLALLWSAGRLALLFSAYLAPAIVAVLDSAFVPVLGVYLARPLLSTKNRRNFVMLAVLGALFAANAVVHLQALGALGADVARRAALVSVDVIVLLMSIIAGRVFPMFTRNATGVASIRSLPWLDRASLVAMLGLTAVDGLGLEATLAASWLALSAALLAAARARHWGARHSLRTPLLWILHAGYAWLVLGLALRGTAGIFGWPIGSAAIHALTVGAMGSLTLGMMARVALGHTGRMLVAPRPMSLAFGALTLAAAVRVLVPLLAPSSYADGLLVAGLLWTLAFALFVWCYLPILARPRVDGKPG